MHLVDVPSSVDTNVLTGLLIVAYTFLTFLVARFRADGRTLRRRARRLANRDLAHEEYEHVLKQQLIRAGIVPEAAPKALKDTEEPEDDD